MRSRRICPHCALSVVVLGDESGTSRATTRKMTVAAIEAGMAHRERRRALRIRIPDVQARRHTAA